MLILKKIFKSYGDREILSGLNLELEQDKICALLGANGAGKTTLFNILTGFLKADSGSILYKGRELGNMSPIMINNLGITRTFQNLRLIEGITVKENILLAIKRNKGELIWNSLLPVSFLKGYYTDLDKRADEIINKVFLDGVTYRKAGEISYGEQKLLTLGCCLANDAELLLLDEPVSGLNDVLVERIINLVKEIKKFGKTILFIDHNIDFIKEVCDQVFFLTDGLITTYKSYKQFSSDKKAQEDYS